MARRSGFAKVLSRAALGPVNLSVVGAAVVGAVALASWPIAALGGAAYAALVASDVSSPAFRRRILSGRAPAAPMPRPEQCADAEVRAVVEKLVEVRAELTRVVRETPERVRRNVAAALGSLDELERHASVLVARAEDLHRYLTGVKIGEARGEAERLALRASSATDPEARRQYEAAAAAANERVRALDDIGNARDRVRANLYRVVATLQGVPPKLVRLRALDAAAGDALSGDVGAELERMTVDLRAFETTLESLIPATEVQT